MYNFSALPIGSIILAPSHLHPLLRAEILNQNQGMLGVQIHSVSSYLTSLYQGQTSSNSTILFQYRTACLAIHASLSVYNEAALTPSFLKECLAFIEDMKVWDITIQDLPEETKAHKEIKMLLTTLYPIPTQADQKKAVLQHLSTMDASYIYIYDSCYSFDEQQVIQLLCKQHARLIIEEKKVLQKEFYHATNKRQEIEACAQYIIEHQLSAEDIHMTLCDTTYTPLVEQIFQRYHIPYTLSKKTKASTLPKKAQALLQYYLKKDTKAFMNCLETGAFNFPLKNTLQKYLEVFPVSVLTPFNHLHQLQDIGNILDTYNIEKLIALEEQAEEIRLTQFPCFQQLHSPSSYGQLFTSILKILKTSLSNKLDDIPVFNSIHELLKDILPYIKTDEDLIFAFPFFDTMIQNEHQKELSGIFISTLNQGSLLRPYQFLLGCTQKNYPAFKSKAGIFDERYFEKLPYPIMEQRYTYHLQQVQKILLQSPILIASYPLGTYEGKSLESALEIEQFMKKQSILYPLHQNYIEVKKDVIISEELANQLFVKDGNLRGSISSLERYVKCPFSYFLRYGLGLKEPMSYGFSDSYMGTLSHYVMETLVQTYGKKYTQTTCETLHSLLTKEITCMKNVFLNMEAQLSCTQQRIEDTIQQTLLRLHEFEEHSHLLPWKQEHEFYYDIPLRCDVQLSLHGFIDRMDADGSMACILDYKSSAKTLSQANVFAALQLQLLTYSIVASKQCKKQMLGAFYISLKNENIPMSAGKITRRKPVTYIPIGKEEMQETAKKVHRLNGWTMDKHVEILDDDGTHMSGVCENKDGLIVARNTYSLDTIEQYFTKMYQILGNRILSGSFPIEPNEEACMFCKYKEICRFHGLFNAKPLLLEPDDALYEIGGEEDD